MDPTDFVGSMTYHRNTINRQVQWGSSWWVRASEAQRESEPGSPNDPNAAANGNAAAAGGAAKGLDDLSPREDQCAPADDDLKYFGF